MSEPCLAPVAETLVKIGLATFGVLLGASIAAYVARAKLRRLTPTLLRQISVAASSCRNAYSSAEASVCLSQLSSAGQMAQEIVAAGISKRNWQTGMKHMDDAKLAASQVTSAQMELIPEATASLRNQGIKLAAWLNSIQ